MKGVPVSEEEIQSLRRIARETPMETYKRWGELNAKEGYSLRGKPTVKRHTEDIKEAQREQMERGEAKTERVGLRVTEELAKKYPSEVEEIEKIRLGTVKKEALIREREAEKELFEKSGERERMQQQLAEKDRQIAFLSAELQEAKRNWNYCYNETQKYKPYYNGYYAVERELREAKKLLATKAEERDFYLGMSLYLIAGKPVKSSKKDDETKVFKFGVPTFEGKTFNWSRRRNTTITIKSNGKVLLERGSIVLNEGSLQITELMQKEVERVRRNPYELLAEKEELIKQVTTQLGIRNQLLNHLMKALSELRICAPDTFDIEEIASRIGELQTKLEHACLVISDLLWEKYKVSEEFRLGLPKVFNDKRIIGDKVVKMNFVVYPDRTLRGLGEEEANTLRAEIESEKLRAEKKLAEAEKRIETGKRAEGIKEDAEESNLVRVLKVLGYSK